MDNSPKPTRHKIGCARTIRTAVMVTEYLRKRFAHSTLHPDTFHYVFETPSGDNGYWSADIIVDVYAQEFDAKREEDLSKAVEVCRAFVAGAGEVWA